MKICGIVLTIFFMLFASSFGGTLRFNIGKPSFLTLRLRRREYEVKAGNYDRSRSQITGDVVTKITNTTHQKVVYFHITQALHFARALHDFVKSSPVFFSQTAIFVKNRFLSPPPTPPPIA